MSNPIVIVALVVMAFFLAAASDYLETKYVQAVHRRNPARAARCSVAMWLVGVVGLVAVIEIGWWLLIPEGAGLYVGTMLAMRNQ